MKFKFDHTHYVPVLRWKGAERVALMKLSDDVRRHWGPSPFFLDDMNWPESESGKTIVSMSDAMRSHGLLSIPVTGLDRSKKHQSAVAKIAAKDLRGVSVRLRPSDLQSSSLSMRLDEQLAA
jgi:hypothetical protein